MVSFDDFLKNVINTVIEENGTFEDAVFIAEDSYLKLYYSRKNRKEYRGFTKMKNNENK